MPLYLFVRYVDEVYRSNELGSEPELVLGSSGSSRRSAANATIFDDSCRGNLRMTSKVYLGSNDYDVVSIGEQGLFCPTIASIYERYTPAVVTQVPVKISDTTYSGGYSSGSHSNGGYSNPGKSKTNRPVCGVCGGGLAVCCN